ncbi:MAG: HEAT repeat domain-containing protein [Planctomycetota bacterium]|jgi:mono/diheme cytochrome c family protein
MRGWRWILPMGALSALAILAVAKDEARTPAIGAPRFAGTAACARCHAKESERWSKSPHAHHAEPVATPEGGADGAVGSVWMQAYYKKDDNGLLRIMPQCFDIKAKKWRPVTTVLDAIRGVAPGAHPTTPEDVAAVTFDVDCASCHASQTELHVDAATGRVGARWHEASINCEACHGAGGDHTRAWDALSPDAPMADLRRYSTRASNAVCARCHGGPPAAIDLSPADAQHHIGMLEDRVGFFPDGAASGQVYQYDSFVRSPCVSEGGLRCTDCHPAHVGGVKKPAHADALCTNCHPGFANRAHTHHDPKQAGARCIECHMPRLLDGVMAHQRDHRIRSPLPESPHVADACTACHADKDKTWAAKAYRKWWGAPPRADLDAIRAIVLARSKSPAAEPLLKKALEHDDPWFRANAALYLADPAAVIDDPSPEVRLIAARMAESEDHRTRLIEDAEPFVRAEVMRRTVRRGEGIKDEWRGDLRLALRRDRDQGVVGLTLGLDALESGRMDEARTLLERVIVGAVRDPGRSAIRLGPAWEGIARMEAKAGRTEEARVAHRQSARSYHARWRQSRWQSDYLLRAVRQLLAAGDAKAARRMLVEESRRARGASEKAALREMLVKFDERLQ